MTGEPEPSTPEPASHGLQPSEPSAAPRRTSPVTVVAGGDEAALLAVRLGSGLAAADPGERVAVIAESAAPEPATGVDWLVVGAVEGDRTEGCPCCRSRLDLVQAIRLVLERPRPALRPGRSEPVELTGYPDRVGLLCWTSGGTHLCAAAADEVTVWTPDTTGPTGPDDRDDRDDDGPLRLVGHDESITALAASPTDGLIASGDADGRIRIWAPGRLDRPVGSLSADGVVLALAWRHDGRALAATTSDGSLVTADVRPGAVV